jgi:hypothetical protein
MMDNISNNDNKKNENINNNYRKQLYIKYATCNIRRNKRTVPGLAHLCKSPIVLFFF